MRAVHELHILMIFVIIFHNTFCLEYRGSACSQMFNRAYDGYIPKGNEEAGTYVLIEDVITLEDCITKCCENETCNVALIFNQKCFIVDCKSNYMCLPILHHNSDIRENVSMVLVKPENANESWENILNEQDVKLKNWKEHCPKLYESTYKGFLPRGKLSAGNYSYIEEIADLKTCIVRCCNDDKCNVAVMIDLKCYNIECKSSKSCIPALYPNTTVGKSFSMVLVKPVARMEKWKDILQTPRASVNEESSEEILPEISSIAVTNINSTETGREAINITLRLPMNRKASNKSFTLLWTQIEGPTNLKFSERNKSVYDIGNLTIGNYIIKLSVKDEEKVQNLTDIESTENVTKQEPIITTTLSGNQNEV